MIVNGRIDDCDPPPHRDKIPMVVRHERRMIKRTIGFIKFPCPIPSTTSYGRSLPSPSLFERRSVFAFPGSPTLSLYIRA